MDRITEGSDYIICALCGAAVAWRSPQCPECHFEYDQQYWGTDAEYEAHVKVTDVPDPDDDDFRLSDGEVPDMWGLPSWLNSTDIYADSRCMGCVHSFTGDCDEYTGWLLEFDNMRALNIFDALPEPIPEYCNDYMPAVEYDEGADDERAIS